MAQFKLSYVVCKLNNIAKYINQLQESVSLNFAEYKGDFNQQLIVDRLLYLLLASATDINRHLVTSCDRSRPQSYRDSFVAAGGLGAISSDLSERIIPSAGLQKHLLHSHYSDADLDIVHSAAIFALEQYPQYLEQMRNYVECLEKMEARL